MLAFDEGSFRDPDGRVFFYEENVYRTLDPSAVERMKALLSLPFFAKWVESGNLINTKLMQASDVLPGTFYEGNCILWHEKVSTITYPFEWTFSMLKDAALLTLNLMETLIENNYILKDGTAWNICFKESRSCFYDVLSIDTYREGQPWEGLTQFLQEFYYPLMLQSYHGINFQPLWRATQQGIPVSLLYKTLSKIDIFKKGVFKYVYLQEKFSANKAISEAKLKGEFSKNAFSKHSLLHMIKDLQKCIKSFEVTKHQSVWKEYDSQNSYKSEDVCAKEKFIEEGLDVLRPASVIDLGCNTGHYSLIAAKTSQVISCDLDPICVDYIYLQKNPKILPIVLNLMTPSPAMGWHLKERKDIFSRIKVGSFMSLALMHHLCITYNVPLESFVKLLRSIAPCGIVEWVDKKDPMVQFLLRNRTDIFNNYTWENFQKYLNEYFNIEKVTSVNDGCRNLVLLSEKL
jgi:hypothetical protein